MHLTRFLPAPRWGYAFAALICASLIGYALYLQYYQYQEPCPLCMAQRVFIIAMGIVFFIGAIWNPKARGATLLTGLLTVLGASGAAISARHVYIQYLPPEQVPQCGPGLDYMLSTLPLGQAIAQILHGSGECADKSWMFLGLTIPGWTFLFFVGLIVWAWLLHLKKA